MLLVCIPLDQDLPKNHARTPDNHMDCYSLYLIGAASSAGDEIQSVDDELPTAIITVKGTCIYNNFITIMDNYNYSD